MPIYTRRNIITPKRSRPIESLPTIAARLNKGMVTTIDSVDLDDDTLTLAINVRVRFDKTLRRQGLDRFAETITEPDLRVISFGEFRRNDGTNFLYMYTGENVYQLEPGTPLPVWSLLTSNGVIDGVRVQSIVFFNDFYFANGFDEIQKVDAPNKTYDDIENANGFKAPRMKFITGFFNRIVGFNQAGGDPTLIAWSADGKGDEWDPVDDLSAGSATLIDSPSDRSDYGTGIFAFDNIVVLFRERSIWLGNKQPIARLPFNFYTQVPGQGCDSPYSTQVFNNAIFFVDTRTKGIYVYTVGSRTVDRISLGIENEFFLNIDDPGEIFSAVDTANNEYIVGAPIGGTNIVRLWVYNILNGAWSYDEYDPKLLGADNTVTAVAAIEDASAFLPIDALIGTIDALSGIIDDLRSIITSAPNIIAGGAEGQTAEYKLGQQTDFGVIFESIMDSKDFAINEDDVIVTSIRIDLFVRTTSTVQLLYNLTNSNEAADFILAKTETFTVTNKRKRIRFKKNIHTRYLRWRLTCSSGDIEVLDYKINISAGGDTT